MMQPSEPSKPEEPASSDKAPRQFVPEKAEMSIWVHLGSRFWNLFHEIPQLYAALLDRLSTFGVTAGAIRTDAGDNSIGGYNVNFWMLDFRVIVRIRLESVEFNCVNLQGMDIEQITGAFAALVGALHSVKGDNGLNISNYVVNLSLHGTVQGTTTKDFVAQFVAPPAKQPAPMLGSGVSYYFGERRPVTFFGITADLSGALAERLYLKFHVVTEGSLTPEALRQVTDQQFTLGMEVMGLSHEAK